MPIFEARLNDAATAKALAPLLATYPVKVCAADQPGSTPEEVLNPDDLAQAVERALNKRPFGGHINVWTHYDLGTATTDEDISQMALRYGYPLQVAVKQEPMLPTDFKRIEDIAQLRAFVQEIRDYNVGKVCTFVFERPFRSA